MSKKKALPKPKAVPVSQLKEHKKNPRVIDDFKLKALRKSLQEFGDMMEVRPVLYDEDNIVLAGNMRLRAARELGWATIMGIQVKGLSRSEKEELLIKDNVNYGVWDDAILDNHFDVESLEAWTGEVRVDYSFLDAFTDLDEDLEEKASSVVRSIAFHLPNHFYKIKDMTVSIKNLGLNVGDLVADALIEKANAEN